MSCKLSKKTATCKRTVNTQLSQYYPFFYIFADMEDYIIREIDRIGEMLMQIARRLGLLDGDAPDYSMSDVKDEFGKAGCPVDLVTVLQQEYPVWYLVEKEKLSVHGLETMIDTSSIPILTRRRNKPCCRMPSHTWTARGTIPVSFIRYDGKQSQA